MILEMLVKMTSLTLTSEYYITNKSQSDGAEVMLYVQCVYITYIFTAEFLMFFKTFSIS